MNDAKLKSLAAWMDRAARQGPLTPEMLSIAATAVLSIAEQVAAQEQGGGPYDQMPVDGWMSGRMVH